MKERVLIHSLGGSPGELGYRCLWRGRQQTFASIAEIKSLFAGRRVECWLLLAGDRVRLDLLPCSTDEYRHLRQALPYELEETLIDSVDQLHFAYLAPKDLQERVAVACCNRDWLAAQLQPFVSEGLEIHGLLPAPLALTYSGGWTLCWVGTAEAGELWVRYGEWQGFVLDAPLAAIALNQLREEQGVPPQITLLADSEAALAILWQLLPPEINAPMSERLQPLEKNLAVAEQPLNLRQGDFALRLPLVDWWRQWRGVAALALAALILFVGVNWLEYRQLRDSELSMRRQIEQVARTVIPRGALQQPSKQLRNKLRALTGSGGDSAALALLSQVAPVIVAQQDIVLRNLNFNANNNELRLSCWAPSFETLQILRTELGKRGLSAELVHASADGDGQQGRLNIRAQQT